MPVDIEVGPAVCAVLEIQQLAQATVEPTPAAAVLEVVQLAPVDVSAGCSGAVFEATTTPVVVLEMSHAPATVLEITSVPVAVLELGLTSHGPKGDTGPPGGLVCLPITSPVDNPFNSQTTFFPGLWPLAPDLTKHTALVMSGAGGARRVDLGKPPGRAEFALSGTTDQDMTFGTPPDPEDFGHAWFVPLS